MVLLNECVQTGQIELDKLSELDGLKEVLDNHTIYTKQVDQGYVEFIGFLLDKEEQVQELILIKKADWDEFYSTGDEDYEMKIAGYVQASEFYNRFNDITGIELDDFDNNFVSAKYIDKNTYNTIELTIRIENKDEVFIIDAV